jgi:hypothetical protein
VCIAGASSRTQAHRNVSPVCLQPFTVRDSNPSEGKRHSLLHTRPDRHYSPPSLPYNAYRGSWPGTKRPGLAVHRLPLSSAKIEWSYTSTVRACMACYGETCTSHRVQLRPGKAVRFATDQLLGPPSSLVSGYWGSCVLFEKARE